MRATVNPGTDIRLPALEDWFLKRRKRGRKLAARICRNLPLATCAVPFDIPPIHEAVQWHVTSNNDFVIQCVIGQLREVVQELYGTSRKGGDAVSSEIGVQFQANDESALAAPSGALVERLAGRIDHAAPLADPVNLPAHFLMQLLTQQGQRITNLGRHIDRCVARH